MSLLSHPGQEALLQLRSIGVKSGKFVVFNSDEMMMTEVEFFPPTQQREPGPILPKSMTQDAPHMEEKCACGHDINAHDGQGLCLMGDCQLEVCARSVAK